ncbi:hypothetical protein VFPPC_14794 [Pochonia chlamydosporia 170]|uniref:Uncharacterized protein n=1 Tax=Pochonia chlamydosporia 170 TaxID=1380566 RepID=A0A179F446_METCM|nr:hypothetical protein VFPPC_14794 [Pochonia chlamydosporia 170]OAQ60182.1 hypothetical protein VFPPC_14794 [Pochonia chlamydosporia 170]
MSRHAQLPVEIQYEITNLLAGGDASRTRHTAFCLSPEKKLEIERCHASVWGLVLEGWNQGAWEEAQKTSHGGMHNLVLLGYDLKYLYDGEEIPDGHGPVEIFLLALKEGGCTEPPREVTDKLQKWANLKVHYERSTLAAAAIWRLGIHNTYALCWERSYDLHKLPVQLSVNPSWGNTRTGIVGGHHRRVGNELRYVWRKFTEISDNFWWRIDLNSLPITHPGAMEAWKLHLRLEGKVVTMEEVLDYLQSHIHYNL